MWNRRHLLCAVLLPFSAAAEIVCALGSGAASYKASADQRPAADAMEMARRLNAALSRLCARRMCPQIAIFRNTTAANAMLVVTSDQAKFVYAPQFFQTVYDNYGDGAIIAIIAHEFGHALDEIYPARFKNVGAAGVTRRCLGRMRPGAVDVTSSPLSSNDLAETLTALSKYPSPAHPNWALRLPALRIGYTQCGGDGSKFDSGAGGNKRYSTPPRAR